VKESLDPLEAVVEVLCKLPSDTASVHFAAIMTQTLLQCSSCLVPLTKFIDMQQFSKLKTELYTDTPLSQVSHRKTANSQKHKNGTFTNKKPNHSTRCRLPHCFKKGVWRVTYWYFDVLIIIHAKNSNFRNLYLVTLNFEVVFQKFL
jgi:hypothetical protein